jgi:hypothetical protein
MTTAAPADLLATIVAAAHRIVQVREAAKPAAVLAREQTRTPRGVEFERALRGPETTSGGPLVASGFSRTTRF